MTLMPLQLIIPLVLCSNPHLPDDPPAVQPDLVRNQVLESGRFDLDEAGRARDGQLVDGSANRDRTLLAILPDRTTGDDRGLDRLQRAVQDLALLRPDAVFCVGDLVQGYKRDLADYDREVDDFLRIIDPLDADFWPTAGNHDVISGSRDASDDRFADRYRARFGPLHYAVRLDHGTVVVLFSDENLDGGDVDISDAQIDWLAGVLAEAAPDEPIVLLMHRPLWRQRGVNWNDRVHPLLVEHGVDAVIAGHFHALHRDADRDGVEYHLLGVCGGGIDQHPLTGQFDHLTLPDLGPGDEVHLRHLPVGVVLPDDFVLRADQDRAYALKRRADVVSVDGSVADPWRDRVADEIEIGIRNPIDRPVTFAFAPAGPAEPWLVDGHEFLSRTPVRFENRVLTDLETPFTIDLPEPVTLEPGERRSFRIPVTAPRVDAPPLPPEFEVTATFTDDQDRRVPLHLSRRSTIDRRDPEVGDGRPRWPIAGWAHSVYETIEPLGFLTTSTDEDSGDVIIDLEIADDRFADDDASPQTTIRDRRNPHGDLVVVTIRTVDGPRAFLFEPASPDRLLEFDPKGGIVNDWPAAVRRVDSDRTGPDPTRRVFRIRLPNVRPDALKGVQVEVADNDRAYHTQWRRLAPRGRMLEFGPQPAPDRP
ncbi:MAG: hypothetical protein GY825_10145 [Phycisphaeraceae bacterium]|nr:hypothetical protein [Phycisphaeraceae bacterium]